MYVYVSRVNVGRSCDFSPYNVGRQNNVGHLRVPHYFTVFYCVNMIYLLLFILNILKIVYINNYSLIQCFFIIFKGFSKYVPKLPFVFDFLRRTMWDIRIFRVNVRHCVSVFLNNMSNIYFSKMSLPVAYSKNVDVWTRR